MKILGITMGMCSSAALLVDDRIVAGISEERFEKNKNYDGYPRSAIEFCLSYGNIDSTELDYVVLASENVDPDYVITHHECNRSIDDWLREMHEYWYPILYEGKTLSYTEVFSDKIDKKQYPANFEDFPFGAPNRIELFREFRRDIIAKHLKIPKDKIRIIEHHFSHAAYALLAAPSRSKETLVFTADGFGDRSNASIRTFLKGKFNLQYETDICNIGRLYRYITLLLGMKPGEHEYKLMGLAPYSHPEYIQGVLKILHDTLYVNGIEFKYKTKPHDHYFWFKDKFEGQRFDTIAGGLQKYVEELLTGWFKNAAIKYGISSVAFSGGVSLNIKANKEILSLPEISSLAVPGSGGDESLAMGAIFAFLLDKGVAPDEIATMDNLYLGDSLKEQEVEEYIHKKRLSEAYKITFNVSNHHIAELLAQGEIIGRFAGRMEFGQRALGNRSILANPSNPESVKIINEMIKQRDFWMPFAPTILYEDCDRYIYNPKGIYSPFMTIAFDSKPQAQKDLIAALHPADFTVRPQMLKREVNPKYYDIIAEFKALTGIGGILNTSFNLHGLPIVQELSDALKVMENSKMKFLLLENILLEKKH